MILLLDFGGTKLTAALISPDIYATDETADLHLADMRRHFSPDDANGSYELKTMLGLADELLDGQTPQAIGVSFGGPVDFASGTVRLSHHVSGWENVPLQQLLEARYDAPARIDNDANVGALGEWRFGAGRGYDSLMYITISTGVGGGWVLNGRPWRGVEGMAGEIGHNPIDPKGPTCLCGKKGCVERLASGPYMAQDGLAAMSKDEALETSLRKLETVTGKAVAEAAKAGDPLGLRLLQRSGWAIGTGIGSAANLINPELFVLGGGVTKSGEIWETAVHKAARTVALPEISFEMKLAELGDEAVLWGAAALVEELLEEGHRGH